MYSCMNRYVVHVLIIKLYVHSSLYARTHLHDIGYQILVNVDRVNVALLTKAVVE